MSVLDLTELQGSTFVLAEVLDVFEQVDAVLSGTSSSFAFTVSGDNGSGQSIISGNTLHIDGGNGISTTGEATDTIRIVVDLSDDESNILGFDTNGKLLAVNSEVSSTVQSKFLINDFGHGFGSANQIILLRDDFELAKADSANHTADFVGLIIDTDSYYILGAGFHTVTAHGLEIGKWYALSNSVLGGYEISYLIGLDEIKQNAFIPIDTNTIYVNLQEADLARVVSDGVRITKTSHGFTVGTIVSLVGGVWVLGVAGQECFFVIEIIDVNNFIIGKVWSGTMTVTLGKTYAINPSVDGAIVDVSTLTVGVDPITRIGFASKTNFLLGFCEYANL